MSDIRVEAPGSPFEADELAAEAPLVSRSAEGLVIDLRTRRPAGPLVVEPLRGLPEFPDTEPLGLAHVESVCEHGLEHDPYSDFNAASLWGWGGSVEEGYRVARHGANLVVEFGDYLTGERFLSFFGTDRPARTARALLRSQRSGGRPLRLVPEVTAAGLDPAEFEVVEDPDAADYLYLTAEGASPTGKRYRSLRYSHNVWEKRWADRSELHWMSTAALAAMLPEILELVDRWRNRGTDGAAHGEHERCALAHLLGAPPEVTAGLDGWSGVATTDGELTAVFVNEVDDGRRLTGHYLKATDAPPGERFQAWFFVELCRRASHAGIALLNLQQDLGIPGLRAAKEALRPHRKLRKYSVSLRR